MQVKVHQKWNLPPPWTYLVLNSLLYPQQLCHSFKSCALHPSLQLHQEPHSDRKTQSCSPALREPHSEMKTQPASGNHNLRGDKVLPQGISF